MVNLADSVWQLQLWWLGSWVQHNDRAEVLQQLAHLFPWLCTMTKLMTIRVLNLLYSSCWLHRPHNKFLSFSDASDLSTTLPGWKLFTNWAAGRLTICQENDLSNRHFHHLVTSVYDYSETISHQNNTITMIPTHLLYYNLFTPILYLKPI